MSARDVQMFAAARDRLTKRRERLVEELKAIDEELTKVIGASRAGKLPGAARGRPRGVIASDSLAAEILAFADRWEGASFTWHDVMLVFSLEKKDKGTVSSALLGLTRNGHLTRLVAPAGKRMIWRYRKTEKDS